MKLLKDGEYYGQQRKEWRTNGIILSEYAYVVPKTDWHYHENPYFMYLLQGEVYDVNKKITKTCASGTLLFHNWQEQHFNAKNSPAAKGFHIEFKEDYLKNFELKALTPEGSIAVRNPDAHILLSKLYYEFCLQDSFSDIGIESLLLALCQNVEVNHTNTSTQPLWLQALTELIYEENDKLSIKELSQKLGVHPVHISRTFPKYFGCTLSEYLRMVKVKKAIPHLLQSQYNLTEIAYLCGFADQSHFSKTFKYYLGRCPRDYGSRLK